jgi:hypothetical protein
MAVNTNKYKFDSVYLLQEIEEGKPTGLYKIGYTTGNTERRMKQYRAGNARTVVDFYTIIVDEGAGQPIEAKIHNQFDSQRIKNVSAGDEWFRLDLDQLQVVIRYMSQFDCDCDNMIPSLAWTPDANPLGKEVIGTASFDVHAPTPNPPAIHPIDLPTNHLLYRRRRELVRAANSRLNHKHW